MARSAWEVMTGQTGSIRKWSQPGLDRLGARAPGEKAPKPRKPRKPAPPKNDYRAHRDREEMDLLDQINKMTGLS